MRIRLNKIAHSPIADDCSGCSSSSLSSSWSLSSRTSRRRAVCSQRTNANANAAATTDVDTATATATTGYCYCSGMAAAECVNPFGCVRTVRVRPTKRSFRRMQCAAIFCSDYRMCEPMRNVRAPANRRLQVGSAAGCARTFWRTVAGLNTAAQAQHRFVVLGVVSLDGRR